MKFGLVIDESGDTGLDNLISWLKPGKGSLHIFIFGAYVVALDTENPFATSFAKWKGNVRRRRFIFCDLDHSRRTICAQDLANAPITAFGLISDKTNLIVIRELLKSRSFSLIKMFNTYLRPSGNGLLKLEITSSTFALKSADMILINYAIIYVLLEMIAGRFEKVSQLAILIMMQNT